MTTWLQHPKYASTRDRLIEYLRSEKYRFRRLEPVLFLCGGAGSKRRDTLRDYLRKHKPWVNVFYAELVWDLLSSQVGLSALKVERDLAALADLVIIIVESPGTFAELGAFSLSDELRKKLLPIVDVSYQGVPSFITTGPLSWINTESTFAPTIYVSLPRILQAADEVEERIGRVARTGSVRITDLAASPKHLLFFLCDLIAVIHPATGDTVEYYLQRIAPSLLGSDISVQTLIGLATAMGLLRTKRITSKEVYYMPADAAAIERPYHHTRMLDLPSQRAAHAAALLSIQEARDVLVALERLP